jgi:chromate transporter
MSADVAAGPLPALAALFAELSMLAIGGANALVPEMQRRVAAQGWMGPSEFAALFALAQAAPGPNMLVVTLVGWRAAGWSGAAVATGAFIVPSGILTYAVSRLWHRFREARWRRVVQTGLTPVTVGLVMAAGVLLCQAAATDAGTLLVSLATAVLMLATRLHPLWLLAAGGALGAAGLL